MSFFRLSHDFLPHFSAALQHEFVLTCTYVTLVTLSFSLEFPALARYQPVHTPYGFSSQTFTTVRYFCSCFCIPYQISPQGTNFTQSRKNSIYSVHYALSDAQKVRKKSFDAQKLAKIPHTEKCKSRCGLALHSYSQSLHHHISYSLSAPQHYISLLIPRKGILFFLSAP